MKIILTFIFSITLCASTFAQSVDLQVLGSTGQEISGSNGTLVYTLGEPVTETFSNDSFQLTQGFHQGYFLFVGVEENTRAKFSAIIYPNPALEYTNLELLGVQNYSDFEYYVYDLTGKQLKNGRFDAPSVQLNLSGLSNSMYILKIQNNNQGYTQTYQLQKIK